MGEPARRIHPEAQAMWEAVLAAPLADEPETEEERLAIQAIEADIRAGRRGYTHAEVHALIEDLPVE